MYKNLEILRKTKKLTIDDMAKVISKSPANYYKKEKGDVSITVKEAILIAHFSLKDTYDMFYTMYMGKAGYPFFFQQSTDD